MPFEKWNKTYGGAGEDRAASVNQTSDGEYVLVGTTALYGGRSSWLVKTDIDGNEQWNKTFGTGDWDQATSVKQTVDGGYIIAGGKDHYRWLLKTDSSGDKLWNKTFGIGDWDLATSVQQTSDGGYVVGGWEGYYYPQARILKTDTSGIEQWDRAFSGEGTSHAWSVRQTLDGGYILAGDTSNISQEGYILKYNGLLIKADANGIEQWVKTFNISTHDEIHSIQQTSDGGYILAGMTVVTINSGTGAAVWLIKTDENGNQQWNKTFGYGGDYAESVQQTSDGGYILAGSFNADGHYRAWLIKTDTNGNLHWDKLFKGKEAEASIYDSIYGHSVQQTSDGGYILAADGGPEPTSDAWLIKVSADNVPSPTFNISGFKIDNVTGSSVQDWNITLTNSTMQTSTITGADGSYKFMNLVNGSYNLTEEMQAGWTNVSPISQQVIISGADVININFTNRPPFVYVALGDSYQSGEGAGTPMSNTNDYLTKAYENGENYPQSIGPQSNTYSKDLGGDACHRALENYAKLNSEKLKPYVNGKDIILVDVTCSGAKIVPSTGEDERPPIVSSSDSSLPNAIPFYCLGNTPSTICNKDVSSQVKQALEQLKLKGLTADDVNLVTIGMGGNDARFADIVSACITSNFLHRSLDNNGLSALGIFLSPIGYQTCEEADQTNLHVDGDINSLYDKEVWAQNQLLGIFKKAKILQLNYPNILPKVTQSAPSYCGGIRKEDIDYLHRIQTQINNKVQQTVESHNDPRIKLVNVENAFGNNPPCPSQDALANGIDEKNFNTEVNHLWNEDPQVVQIKNNIILIDLISIYFSNDYAPLVADLKNLHDYVTNNKTQKTIQANFIFPPTLNGENETIRYDHSAGLFHPNAKGYEVLACYVRVAYGSGETCPIPVNNINNMPPVPTPTNTVMTEWSTPIQGTIKPNEVKMHTVFIDNTTKKADFNLFWLGSDFDLVLYTPSGVKINSSVASNYSNINYTSGPTFESYEIQSPESGNWTMEIIAVNVTSTGENYSAITFIETNLSVIVGINKESYVPNEPIALAAYVQDNETPLSRVNVTAIISRPDGTNSTIQLYDNGLHNDNQADDGIYVNVYTGTNISGKYYITISANGIIRNESFKRKAFKNVWIESYPDLASTSSDINFSNDISIPGENITINATIHNIGDADANNSSIILYDGNPASGVLISQVMINVSAGQTATVSSSWNTTAGQHEIYILINPFNEFLEKNYTNNKAFKIINVGPTPSPQIQVTNPSANPSIIVNDSGRTKMPGTNITRLNITVTGNVSSVTINLSPIGGQVAAPMTKVPGTDMYTITTNATSGINLTNNLVVNATDTSGNFNNSVSILLTVLLRGDIVRDNRIDLKDLLYLRKYLANNSETINKLVADIQPAEGDGKVDLKDLLFLRRYLAGLETLI